jgi:hypothetical protein
LRDGEAKRKGGAQARARAFNLEAATHFAGRKSANVKAEAVTVGFRGEAVSKNSG